MFIEQVQVDGFAQKDLIHGLTVILNLPPQKITHDMQDQAITIIRKILESTSMYSVFAFYGLSHHQQFVVDLLATSIAQQ